METDRPHSPAARGPRRLIGFVVVGIWLLAIGLLVRREYGGSAFLGDLSAPLSDASDVAYAVLVPGRADIAGVSGPDRRVGEVRMARGPEARDGFAGNLARVDANLSLLLLGKATDLQIGGDLWRPDDPAAAGRQADLDFSIRSQGHDFQLVARLADGRLAGEVRSAGEALPIDLPVGDDVLVESGFGASLRFPQMAVGESLRFDSFDPLTLSRGRAKVTCVAEETLDLSGQLVATRRLRVEASGIDSVAWIDGDGDVVRAETPLGLVLQRLPAGASPAATTTMSGQAAIAAGDFLGQTSVTPTGPAPRRGASRLVLRLSGVDLEAPGDEAQRKLEGPKSGVTTLEIVRRLPGDPAGASAGGAHAPYLAADPFVQSDHSEIIGRARRIVGDERDPWRRALLLYDWVHERIDKEPVVSIPSALEVLRQRRGDCNEHTVLYAALARALGIPTRIAIGLVWSDELAGFYYHAWPEVLVQEPATGWVRIDPTLGQEVADATHVKLLEGGIETWPRLLAFLGKLEIEVVEMQMPSESEKEPAP